MKWWPTRPTPYAAAVPTKSGLEISYSDVDNFQRNRVSVRTVISNSAGSSSSYGLMYRRQPAVRAVVDFLARNIGQLNPKVYVRVSNTDRMEVGDHPLAELLRRPNAVTTRYRHQRDTVADLAIYDRAYWAIIRSGRQVSIARVPPANIQIANVDGRTVYRGLDGEIIPRSNLVVFSGYSPEGNDDGVSPLETLRRVLQEEQAAVTNRETMWLNANRQSGWIARPADAPEWSDDARVRFREDITSVVSGATGSGNFPVLEEGMTWHRDQFAPPTDDYIAGRRLTYEEVAIAYGVPPSIIGMGSETKSNAEEHHRQVYQDVLGPWLRMFQDEIELQLLPIFEPLARSNAYVEFNLTEKLKGSFEEQGKTLVTAVGVPYMTPNEGRARLNLPRIDDPAYDVPIKPLNVLYGGQPAVTAPTADPGTAAAPAPLTKAAGPPEAALRRREDAVSAHAEVFRKFFDRQQQTIKSAKAVDDRSRWYRELSADLYALATQVARTNGELAAQQLRGVYDHPRTLDYLAINARAAAEAINDKTFEALDAATNVDEMEDVFDVARSSRTDMLSLSRATFLVNFARVEAAKHSSDADGRERVKTWVVTSAKSRHPEMDGQQVPVGEMFDNGLAWPGDSSGGAEEVAGCKCLLQLS